MRRACKIAEFFTLAIFLAFATLPALAYEPVTIAQLEQMLAVAHGESDKALAKELGELELTERLSTLRLDKLRAGIPGEKSRLALLVLSDTSAFHDLPAAEISQLAPPDGDTQSQILAKTADYARVTLHQLIDIVVSRDTNHFDNLKVVSFSRAVPAATANAKKMSEAELDAARFPPVASAVVENQPYRLIGKNSETITYRSGEENVVSRSGKAVVAPPENAPKRPPSSGVSNWGVFGPLPEIVANDISAGKVDWDHWEQTGKSTLAVFRYSVPEDLSNYNLEYCCFTSGKEPSGEGGKENWNVYETLPSYHGEITIDPKTGGIRRLTIQTDISANQPIYRADIMVEYGPVELGGTEHLLPARSVTIFQASIPIVMQEGNCVDLHCTPRAYVHPKDTVVSDTVYGSYRVFSSDSRILPADASGSRGGSPSSSQPQNATGRKH